MDAEPITTLLTKEKPHFLGLHTPIIKLLATVVIFNLAIIAVLVNSSVSHSARVVVDDLSGWFGPSIASIWCLISLFGAKSRPSSEGKVIVHLLSGVSLCLGVLCFAIGQGIWSYNELVLLKHNNFPSCADFFYLGSYPFFFVGVFLLPCQPANINKRMVLLFEAMMLMTGIATLSWYFALGPTVIQSNEQMIARLIGSIHPLFDLGMICCIILVYARSGRMRMSPVGFLMTTGLASIVLADFLFDYKTLHNTYVPGTPLDSAWTFGYMMVALAGYTVSGKEGCADDLLEADDLLSNKTLFSANKQYQSTLTEWRPLFVQYAVVFEIAFLLWLGFHFGADDRLQAGVCVGAAAVFILLLVRQYFMICENKQLTSRLLEFSENLEAVVDVRTQELALQTSHILALHTLTAAINETLDEGKVLNTAVEQIGYVFEAEAVAVWLASGNSGTDLLPQAYAGAKEDSDLFQKAGRCELLERCHSQQISVVEGAGREISFEYLQVPLRSRGITFGKIGVIRYLTDYTGPEIALLDSMSSYVATAFDNAKQYWNAREAADQDPVTAVMNHRAIHEYLDTAIELDTSFDEPLTVILADIDNFHLFNNTYGHPVGDDVLRKIGQILDRALVAPCKVGRYRGDEFIIVLPGLAGDLAINLAQRLQCLISDLELHYGDDDRSIPASMSYGVASFPADSADKQELLVTASRNLQTAKTSEDHIFALSNLQRAHHELRVGSSFRMLDGMVTAVDNKDSYTRKHSEDVTEYALWIAEEMGLSDEDKHLLRAGGLLHDVGKIGVPDEILRKPGRLTDEEYTIMKQHPTLGALIVGGVPDMEGIIDIVRHHHEQWDGAGYPNGLAGEDIPFNARVMAIADAMSAMTTDRPYRKGLSFDTAIERIRKGMGTQFDPTLAATFLQAAYKRHSPENKCPALEQELRKAA